MPNYGPAAPTLRTSFILLFVALASLGSQAQVAAQQPGPPPPYPRLLVVMPPGGKVGTSFEATLSGQDLDNPQALVFSTPGIKTELLPLPPQPPPDPKKPVPPPPLPPVRFRITIAADTPLGIHDVRLVNPRGISNPRAFMVGDLAEVAEKEPNNDVPEAQRLELNTTVNGTISAPTDVDYFVFFGKKGQRVVLSCLASTIDSRLIASLELYDASGHWLGSNRHYSENDALLDSTLSADGDYYVRLSHFTYTQGSAEHFYRLTISTTPWIDAIFPPMVEPGRTEEVTIYGRNLPQGKLDPSAIIDGHILEKITATITAPGPSIGLEHLNCSGHISPVSSGLDGFEYRLRNDAGASNPYRLTFAQAPVVVDNEVNDRPEAAQMLTLPCEIAGRVEKLRDRDWYGFAAKKGEIYSIEAYGERLGSPVDLYFTLRNAETKQELTEQDDNPDTLAPFKFSTRSQDPPRFWFIVPADGKYLLQVGSRDADTVSGPRSLYRVRITSEQPDFRLVVMPPSNSNPDATLVAAGSNQNFDVFVWRQDGWNGEITLEAEGLPPGITCPPQVIGPGLKYGVLVVSAAADAPPWTGEIKVKGTGIINGRSVVREARPASITWPVNQPTNLTFSRLDHNLVFAVRDQPFFQLTATLDKATVLQGDKVNLGLKLNRLGSDVSGPVQVVPLGVQNGLALPLNVTINNNQPISLTPGKDDANAVVEVRSNALPGTYTLAVRGLAAIGPSKDPKAKQKGNTTVIWPSSPVTLTILPRQLASLSLGSANPTLKVGGQTEVLVKVVRLYDFEGSFKVQVVLPSSARGVTATEVVIPAGQNEGRMVLKAAADAPLGNRPDLVVRAVALFKGKVPTTQEAKMTINVVK